MQTFTDFLPLRWKNWLFFGLLSIAAPRLQANDYPWPEIQKGIQFTVSQQYDSSLQIFQRLAHQAPDDPLGPFFIAATYQAMMMDFETRRWEQDFLTYTDQAIDLAQKRLSGEPENLYSRFFLGAVKSYKAFYFGKGGYYLKAFQLGLNALTDLNKTLRLDSTFYDAYLGLGSYKYWKSHTAKRITRLTYLGDQRQEGVAMIQMAMNQGKFSTWAALNNLAWIEIENGNYTQALDYAEQGLAVFPDSRFFLWPAAEASLKMAKWEPAIAYLQRLLVSVQSEPINNHYNEILLHLKLAQAYQHLGANAMSIDHCQLILQLPISEEIKDRIRNKRQQAQKLLKELGQSLEISQTAPADTTATD